MKISVGLALVVLSSGLASAAVNSLLPPTTGQASVVLIDPEPKTLATPPPKPVEPPPSIRLPEVVSDRRQWRGVQCGVTEPRFALFRHDDKWRSFWEKGMAPYSPRLSQIPAIDFSKEMVVGVFLGEKLYPYSEVEIRSAKIERQSDKSMALIVRYREIHKMSGVFTPEFAIQPFHLLRVPVFEGPVRFENTRRSS